MELLDGENPARGENSSASLFFPHPPSYLTANVGFGQCRCVRSYVCTCVTAGQRGVRGGGVCSGASFQVWVSRYLSERPES